MSKPCPEEGRTLRILHDIAKPGQHEPRTSTCGLGSFCCAFAKGLRSPQHVQTALPKRHHELWRPSHFLRSSPPIKWGPRKPASQTWTSARRCHIHPQTRPLAAFERPSPAPQMVGLGPPFCLLEGVGAGDSKQRSGAKNSLERAERVSRMRGTPGDNPSQIENPFQEKLTF